jgi:hypothetical protein
MTGNDEMEKWGYNGRLLHVDLSSGEIKEEHNCLINYIGNILGGLDSA